MIDSPILSSLYIEMKPHFLIFASFERFLGMAVWNTIDDTYFNFVFYIVTKPSSKLAKNKDVWLRFYIIQKLEYLSSILKDF